MCGNCDTPMPEEVAQHFGMSMATVADEMAAQNDARIRLSCLDLAVRVKGGDNDSRKVLSSANAYYDFVIGKTKHEDVNV